ncbi:restriction endonuclease fold toxin-2 domain-containing protein [Kribbella sp. NPDC051936]|uniref:restriction endonuclease fold toxin-2 domain-containing protein n=1 Tax=Kribbella sp. NPDC051936 TaxID=3154946 RepID=UPI00343470A0
MPSELQRVARGLVDCFDEIPRVVEQLTRTAARCRENAQLALLASRGQATVAAQQLDAAARACEAAAHFLSMAPPKARGWAEGLVGDSGPSTNRPSSDSAKRNRATGGSVDLKTKRLSVTYEDVEVPEDDEPAVITVARKAFEKYRKAREKDDENRDDPEPLELEITVTETGELMFEEPDKKEEQERSERLTRDFEFTATSDETQEPEQPDEEEEQERAERLARDFEIDVELAEAVKALLEAMTEDGNRHWERATVTITTDQLEATFDLSEDPHLEPLVVDIHLPEIAGPEVEPEDLDRDFASYRQRLTEAGRVRPIVGSGPEAEFQRRHCGPIEFRLTRDERLPRAVWADGLDQLLRRAQDAKYVAPTSDSSFYRPDSLPPFLRKIAEEKNDHMLLKYREVIDDDTNPVEGLEIITNDGAAAAYFEDRMRALEIPGQVTLMQREGL